MALARARVEPPRLRRLVLPRAHKIRREPLRGSNHCISKVSGIAPELHPRHEWCRSFLRGSQQECGGNFVAAEGHFIRKWRCAEDTRTLYRSWRPSRSAGKIRRSAVGSSRSRGHRSQKHPRPRETWQDLPESGSTDGLRARIEDGHFARSGPSEISLFIEPGLSQTWAAGER